MGLFSKSKNTVFVPQKNAPITDLAVSDELNVWYKETWSKVTAWVGQYEDKHNNTPEYMAVYPKGWFGPFTLYNAPTAESGVLAHVKINGWMTEASVEYTEQTPDGNQTPCREIVKYKMHRLSERFSFTAQVGHQVEKFEWRRSSGDEVKAMQGFNERWKLVRMGPQRGGDGDAEKDSGDYGKASDGNDIVAVTAFRKGMRRLGKLKLMGAGESGELGHQFKAMVVISHLVMYQNNMMQTTVVATS